MNTPTNNEEKCAIGLGALKNVYDPEIGLNVVDLGLIYELMFNENGIVCTMTLTTQFCPMGESIADNAKMALEAAFAHTPVAVNLVFDPPWSYANISEIGRQFLNG
jgi:metal-sulfur cluster biosynthetic enzyme